MRKITILAEFAFLLLLFLFVGRVASAQNNGSQSCVGNYTFTTFGDLFVPRGQTCQLDQFNTVNGNIRVEKDANLIVCPDNEIHGDIKASKAGSVYVSDLTGGPCSPGKALGITIDGDVQAENTGSVTLAGNPWGGVAIVKGSVKLENVAAVSIQYFSNLSSIWGDVKIEHGGDVVVADNVIGGDLKIKATTGTCLEQNNSVSGKFNSCP